MFIQIELEIRRIYYSGPPGSLEERVVDMMVKHVEQSLLIYNLPYKIERHNDGYSFINTETGKTVIGEPKDLKRLLNSLDTAAIKGWN